MGIVSQLLTKRAGGHPSMHSLASIFGLGRESYTGVNVSDENAITYSAVFAAIRLLAWSTAMLPLLTYRRQDRGKVRAEDHPLYLLLKEEPNEEMTAFDFRSTIMGHAVGRGNGYAEIEWSNGGEPLALWPLNPARTTPKRIKGEMRYLIDLPDGTTANLPSWRVHHVRGLSGNGIVGYSPIRLAMQAIGLGLATEEFGSRFFGNGARPGVVLRHPGEMSDTAYERLRKSWNGDHQGLSNSHRVKILEEGIELETVGIPPEEAQFLETRKFQVTEIARWFNVPPHMIADMSGATFSNIEEQASGYVKYSLQPWLTNIEQALRRDLLTTAAEKKTLLIQHLTDALLQGVTSERYQAYQLAVQGGWMSPNEVRARENMNPYEGGDQYLLPLNMAPADQERSAALAWLESRGLVPGHTDDPDCECHACRHDAGTRTLPKKKQESRADIGTERRRVMEAYIPIYEDVAERMVRREVQDIERAFDKHLRRRNTNSFFTWLVDYYADFRDVLQDAFRPVMMSLAAIIAQLVATELDLASPTAQEEIADFVDDYLADFATGYTAASAGQIQAIAREVQEEHGSLFGEIFRDKLSDRMAEWLEKKAAKTALRQAFQAGNGLVVGNYAHHGVQELIWDASGENCPFCEKLDGKTIGITEFFATAGESLEGGTDDKPLLVRGNKRHGPIHSGCNCTVTAGARSTQSAPAQSGGGIFGPLEKQRVKGSSDGAKAARKLQRTQYSGLMVEADQLQWMANLKRAEADSVRTDLRHIGEGNWPPFLDGDAARADYKQRLEDELDQLVTAHTEALDALDVARAARDKAKESAFKTARRALSGGNYELTVETGIGIRGDETAQLNSAREWLGGFITNPDIESAEFLIDVPPWAERSFYRPNLKQIAMRQGASATVYVHEIGHAIDFQNSVVMDAAHAFYRRRTQGYNDEPLRWWGAGYDEDERTIIDTFPDPYCGRLIDSGGGNEIISMGLQMMHDDPIRLATQDPDYFTMIYDTFRGGGE